MKKGLLVPLAAPSGTGKTTVCKQLRRRNPDWEFSVSLTTRSPRAGEQDGSDYHFVTRTVFEEKIRQSRLVEWEQVFDNYYGTLKSALEAALADRKVLLLDIDVKGALNIKAAYPADTLTIFLLPPDERELNRRLARRGSEDEVSISRRNSRVPEEMNLGRQFDYRIVNDRLDDTVAKIQKLIEEKSNQ